MEACRAAASRPAAGGVPGRNCCMHSKPAPASVNKRRPLNILISCGHFQERDPYRTRGAGLSQCGPPPMTRPAPPHPAPPNPVPPAAAPQTECLVPRHRGRARHAGGACVLLAQGDLYCFSVHQDTSLALSFLL